MRQGAFGGKRALHFAVAIAIALPAMLATAGPAAAQATLSFSAQPGGGGAAAVWSSQPVVSLTGGTSGHTDKVMLALADSGGNGIDPGVALLTSTSAGVTCLANACSMNAAVDSGGNATYAFAGLKVNNSGVYSLSATVTDTTDGTDTELAVVASSAFKVGPAAPVISQAQLASPDNQVGPTFPTSFDGSSITFTWTESDAGVTSFAVRRFDRTNLTPKTIASTATAGGDCSDARFTCGGGTFAYTNFVRANPTAEDLPDAFPLGTQSYQVCAVSIGGESCNGLDTSSNPVGVGPPTLPAAFALTLSFQSQGGPSLSVSPALGRGPLEGPNVTEAENVALSWPSLVSPTACLNGAVAVPCNQAAFSIQRWDPAKDAWVEVGFASSTDVSFVDSAGSTNPLPSFPARMLNYRLCALNVMGVRCTGTSVGAPNPPDASATPPNFTPTLKVNNSPTALAGTTTVSATDSTPFALSGSVQLIADKPVTGPAPAGAADGFVLERWDPDVPGWITLGLACPTSATSPPSSCPASALIGNTFTVKDDLSTLISNQFLRGFPAGPLTYRLCSINLANVMCGPTTQVGFPASPGSPQATFTGGAIKVGATTLASAATQALTAGATVTATGTASLSWSAPSPTASNTAPAGFGVQRWNPAFQTWTRVGFAGPAATTFPDASVLTFPTDVLTYRLCSLTVIGVGCVFPTLGGPGPPTGVAVSSIDNSQTSVCDNLTLGVSLPSLVNRSTCAGRPANTVGGTTKVNLIWSPPASGNLVGFTVARWDPDPSGAGRFWNKIAAGGALVTTYPDAPSGSGAQSYRVCALNVAGTTCAAAVTVGPPGAPQTLSGVRSTSTPTTVNLSWNPPSPAAEAGYAVFRWVSASSSWSLIAVQDVHVAGSGAGQASGPGAYIDISAPTASPQYYAVVAFNQFGAAPSGVATVS